SPGATPDGYAVQPMIQRRDAHELIVGMHRDPIFGPAILFGAGGVAVETLDDTAIGLPPLDDVLGGDMIDATRVGRLLRGYRDRKPADRAALTAALNTVSALVVDFACIDSLDINPLWADENGVVALDARIAIDPARIEETGANRDLSIRPWPADWQRSVSVDEGVGYRLRPIRPADVSLYAAFFARTTPEDMRMRFLTPRRHFSHEALVRLTQLDYDRDIAFVALDQAGELCGVSRLAGDPDRESAEYAVLVRSDLSGHGIGSVLMDILIEYARAEGLKRLSGYVLAENTRMLEFIRRMDFRIRSIAEEPGVVLATKEL
ncbi:MAG: GNAT family N-acetyltransferase, partial [Rhizobiaceae bacterium]